MVPLSVQGGGGRLRPCFPVSSFPSSRNPSPPFPNLEARLKLKFLLLALSSQRSIWASALISHNSWVYSAPLLCTHTGSPASLSSTAPVWQAPQGCSQTFLILALSGTTHNPLSRQRQQQGNSSSSSQLYTPHPVPEPCVWVQTHPEDFPTSRQLMQDSVLCLGTPLRRMPWWVQPGHHLAAALKARSLNTCLANTTTAYIHIPETSPVG